MTLSTTGYQLASWVDPRSGQTSSNVWVEIRDVDYIPNSRLTVLVNIYLNQQSFLSSKSPISSDVLQNQIVQYGDSNWSTFFDKSVMSQANKDFDTQLLAYVQSILGSS